MILRLGCLKAYRDPGHGTRALGSGFRTMTLKARGKETHRGTSQAGSRVSTRAYLYPRHWPTPRGVRMLRLLSARARPFSLAMPAARGSAMIGGEICAIWLARVTLASVPARWAAW